MTNHNEITFPLSSHLGPEHNLVVVYTNGSDMGLRLVTSLKPIKLLDSLKLNADPSPVVAAQLFKSVSGDSNAIFLVMDPSKLVGGNGNYLSNSGVLIVNALGRWLSKCGIKQLTLLSSLNIAASSPIESSNMLKICFPSKMNVPEFINTLPPIPPQSKISCSFTMLFIQMLAVQSIECIVVAINCKKVKSLTQSELSGIAKWLSEFTNLQVDDIKTNDIVQFENKKLQETSLYM